MKMEIGEVIQNIVRTVHGGKNSEQAAGRQAKEYLRLGEKTLALYVALDCRASYHPNSNSSLKEGSAACSLHYLFHRIYGSEGFCSTYTFAAVKDSPFDRIGSIEDSEWKFLSSHDSCWKDAARDQARKVENSLYERVCKQVGFDNNLDHVPYNRLNWNIWFADSEMFQWVDVKIDRDVNDRNDYKKVIQVFKQ